MPTSTLTPGDHDQDEARNIGQQHSDQLVNRLSYAEQRPGSTAANDSKKESTSGEDLAKETQQAERDASGAPAAAWNNNTSAVPTKKKFKLNLKKSGPTSGIVVLLLGLFGIGGTLFTPGLGVIQMKEMLTRDLNDQLSAMNIRSEAVFKAKLKTMSSGICTGVQIKCKFTSMSQRQIDRFKKAGFIIETDGVRDVAFGRKKITFMTAPDGTAIRSPADLAAARKNSPAVRSALNRVFNPLYYGLSDKVANTFLERNKTNKQKKVGSVSEEENRQILAEATSGERAGAGGSVEVRDGDRTYVDDGNGNRVYSDASNYNEVKAAAEARAAAIQTQADAGRAMSGFMSGAGRAVNIVGTADSACTVYNLGRAVGATAKVARSMQLVQFAMVINSTADSIKAGDATPEEVEFIGKMLTETDNRQTVLNETTGQPEDNPNYKKAAFDSAGYKTAAYNDAPILSVESQQYMVGGGLSGSLSSIMDSVAATFGGKENIRGSCGFIQNPWVRGTGLIVGIIVGIGSFGVGTAILAGASVAVSFAIPLLESMLADMISGQVIGENISGVAAGDAMFAGSGALLGGIAQNRGMTPLSSEGIQEYIAATQDSNSEYIATQRYDASNTPFDVTNEYSFLGSLTRSLYPSALKAQSSAAGAITSVGSVIRSGFSSLTKSASAAETFNPDRFTRCNDPGYEELGIDADIFCNVRYGLTAEELAMDTEAVVDFMLESGNINENGDPQGEYARFMDICANRSDGWGDTSEENGSIGQECIDGNTNTFANISYFRVFTMDNSISEAMDEEVAPDSASAPPAGSGKYVLPVDVGYSTPSRFGPRAGGYHRGIDFRGYPGVTFGKPVYAVADGKVIEADKSNTRCVSGLGVDRNNVVRIQHADGAITWYVHMAASDITVNVGDPVTAGQRIGSINTCGNSTGPHLHFAAEPGDATDPRITSIPLDSRDNYFINPETYMALYGVDLYNGTYTDGR